MPAAMHGLFPAFPMQQVKLSGSSVSAALASKAVGTLAAGGDWEGVKNSRFNLSMGTVGSGGQIWQFCGCCWC